VAEWVHHAGPRAICAGDFNTPSDSPIFRSLQRAGLSDAFLTAGAGLGWTYEHRAALTRIDHVMFGGAWSCERCAVGPMMGSPHRPVVADLRLTARANP
jgi:endonuclease/exonuclease/phosphatase (EEP) superfamily protein YafD